MTFHPSRWSIVRTLPTGQMEVVMSNINENMAGTLARLMERTTQIVGARYEAVKGAK